jgi:hypothetical protein
MSSYATYCWDQAAECARRAKLARSPEVAAYCRDLGLRWRKLAERARKPDACVGEASARVAVSSHQPESCQS